MYTDIRYSWLTVDQTLRYRDMARFDADTMPEPDCDACQDSGVAVVEVEDIYGNTAVADIDCECGAKAERRAA
jgi:hypothetical protein